MSTSELACGEDASAVHFVMGVVARDHEHRFSCFSNFFAAPFTVNNVTYATSEHYVQWSKFPARADVQARLLDSELCKTGADALALGRDRTLPLRANWEAVKDDVMFVATFAKFAQNAALRDVLLSTGTKRIVQLGPEKYWGVHAEALGGDGTGVNKLGEILMRVRELLRDGSA